MEDRRHCFAYGANIIAADMAQRCPAAREVQTAALPGWRFAIMENGYATLLPDARSRVVGVLWSITPRCERDLDDFEGVDRGLYRREVLTIEGTPALVYLASSTSPGRPRTGYLEPIIAAAQARAFPADYLEELRRWLA
jgi:gamma-glutamylcyclotransferase (GGCT)/AIG2-like uncharacterized protein YtfP